MRKCQICKHWEPRLPSMLSGQCDAVVFGEEPERDGFSVLAEDSGAPSFLTGRDFGCLQWERHKWRD